MNTKKIRTYSLSFALMLLALGTVGCGGASSSAPTLSPLSPGTAAVAPDANRALIPAQIALANYVNVPGVSTTFTWSVTSSRKPAISHWVVEIDPDCGVPVVLSSSDPLTSWTESDPTTGYRGIKFDTGYTDQEVRTVTLTLQGDWSVGVVGVAIKAGREVEFRQVEGPVCGSVTPVTYEISGIFFFDANGNGIRDLDEPGIPNQVISLSGPSAPASLMIQSTPVPGGALDTTDAQGAYSFTVVPGSYVITFPNVPGFLFSTASSLPVTVVDTNLSNLNGGIVIDFTWVRAQTANGFTIGYWKTNLDKALKGMTRGVQVPAATLAGYVSALSTFALEPLNVTSLSAAYAILNANSPDPASLLAKQLMASEFNFVNGAYIGGNALVTEMFVYQGEFLLKNAASVSPSMLLLAKDRFDAYNNSHGGLVLLP